jgi:hypothetical protein
MAQTGYTPIQLYRTTTAAAAPTSGNLTAGELAINYNTADMSVWALNSAGSVIRLMNNPAGLKYPTVDGTANYVLKTDGAGILSWTPHVTSVTGTSPVVSSGGATPAISIPAATASVSGYLTSTDWSTFNGKYSTGGALGTPSSGDLSSCTNAVAYGLKSATTTVSVSSATAPTAGQILTATSNSAATWQDSSTTGLSAGVSPTYNLALGVGAYSGSSTSANGKNIAIGRNTLSGATGGNGYNIVIGDAAMASFGANTCNNLVCIGTSVQPSSSSITNEVTITNGVSTARFYASASSWTFISDQRDKKNIVDLNIGLSFINKLQPRKFEWDLRHTDFDKGKEASGFIAQEVLTVMQSENAMYTHLVDTNDENQYTLAQPNLIPILVNAIKELTARLELLESKVS